MWNLKYDTNEPIYETETDSRRYRTDLQLLRECVGGWSVVRLSEKGQTLPEGFSEF